MIQKREQDYGNLDSAKTVSFFLDELIEKHAPCHVALLKQIVDSETTYLSDNSKIAQDKVEQLVLTSLKNSLSA